MEKEIWRISKKFSNYAVSDLGRIKRIRKTPGSRSVGHILKPCLNRTGYLYVHLRHNNKGYSVAVHRLVAETFFGERPKFDGTRTEINHIDCDKNNNSRKNLQYVSAKYNKAHAIANGLHTVAWGFKFKINAEIADEIRKDREGGMRNCEIAKKFNVRASLVSDVICNRCWL